MPSAGAQTTADCVLVQVDMFPAVSQPLGLITPGWPTEVGPPEWLAADLGAATVLLWA